MGLLLDKTSVAGNAVNANIFAGQQAAFASRRTICKLMAVTPTTGIKITVTCGNRVILNDILVPVKAADPVEPDDVLQTFAMAPGDFLIVSVRNTTGGAIVPVTMIKTIEI